MQRTEAARPLWARSFGALAGILIGSAPKPYNHATALEANFSLMSIGQNEVMKRFAGWGAIIALPTMIAGIYGMNFAFMPELDWPYSYPLVLALTAALCMGLYMRFRRVGWL